MKIIILSDANSVHTRRWSEALSKQNINVIVFTLFKLKNEHKNFYFENSIDVVSADIQKYGMDIYKPLFSKITYLIALKKLNKLIYEFAPDLIHAHYASSYGILAMLSRFNPYYISIWGDDIVLRKNNFLLKKLLKLTFRNAERIFSTSELIYDELKSNFNFKSTIIPYGVDTNIFKPSLKSNNSLIKIGIIKSLEPYNGIENLINAFNILVKKKIYNIKLIIIGDGSNKNAIKLLINKLDLNDFVTMKSHINHNKIVPYFNDLSVFVCPSIRESFGVAVLEASSCAIPVIANAINGLNEVVKHQKTGFLIDTSNPQEFSLCVEKLIIDKELRYKMGINGRKLIKEKYEWSSCVNALLKYYNDDIHVS